MFTDFSVHALETGFIPNDPNDPTERKKICNTTPCHDFNNNRCIRGEACIFSHTREDQPAWKETPGKGRKGKGGDVQDTRSLTLFVGGLQEDMTESLLKDYFDKFGPSNVSIKIDSQTARSRGFGFVSFESNEGVELCLQETDHFIGDKWVDVKRYEKKGGGKGQTGKNAPPPVMTMPGQLSVEGAGKGMPGQQGMQMGSMMMVPMMVNGQQMMVPMMMQGGMQGGMPMQAMQQPMPAQPEAVPGQVGAQQTQYAMPMQQPQYMPMQQPMQQPMQYMPMQGQMPYGAVPGQPAARPAPY